MISFMEMKMSDFHSHYLVWGSSNSFSSASNSDRAPNVLSKLKSQIGKDKLLWSCIWYVWEDKYHIQAPGVWKLIKCPILNHSMSHDNMNSHDNLISMWLLILLHPAAVFFSQAMRWRGAQIVECWLCLASFSSKQLWNYKIVYSFSLKKIKET